MTTNTSRGSLAVKLAGAGVILGGLAAAGALWWQGTTFDKKLAEATAQLSETFSEANAEIRTAEIDRGMLYRDIAVYLKYDDAELRWIGRADFGFTPSLSFSLDKEWGAAPEILSHVTGFSDKLTITTDAIGRSPALDWFVSPFSVKQPDGTECKMAASRLSGPIAKASSMSLITGSLSCRLGEESFRFGTGRADITYDQDAQFVSSNTVIDGLSIKNNSEAAVEIRKLSFSSSAASSRKNTEPKEEMKFVDADWSMAFDGISVNNFSADRFGFGMRFRNLSEAVMAELAAMSEQPDPDKVSEIFIEALRSDNLIAEITDCSLERNGGKASFLGKLGIEGEQFGRFTVSINPLTYNDIPEVRDALALVIALGQFKAEGPLLNADVVLSETGITVNGQSFGGLK